MWLMGLTTIIPDKKPSIAGRLRGGSCPRGLAGSRKPPLSGPAIEGFFDSVDHRLHHRVLEILTHSHNRRLNHQHPNEVLLRVHKEVRPIRPTPPKRPLGHGRTSSNRIRHRPNR